MKSNSAGVEPMMEILPVVEAFAVSTNAMLASDVKSISITTKMLENL